nr:beta-1,6-N-acetylglucosaminyltransferase [Kineococcus vitellinus]
MRHAQGPGFLDAPAARAAGAEVLLSRIRPHWGHWSLVAAQLEALAEARRRWDPDWTVVVSGQDHPVRDLAAWEGEVVASGADALLRPDERDYDERWRRCWHRVPAEGAAATTLLRAAARLQRLGGRRAPLRLAGGRTWVFSHPRREAAPPLPYRKGSFWATLSRRAVATLLAAGEDDALRAFFASTLLPDESFAHSVLHAAPPLRVAAAPTSYTAFVGDDLAHPQPLGLGDVPAARASGAPFARKVVRGPGDAFARAVDALVDAERSPARER